jgi:hypothetical protein
VTPAPLTHCARRSSAATMSTRARFRGSYNDRPSGALARSNPMSQSMDIDRSAIRAMVEDHWRSLLAVAQTNPHLGRESILRFDEQIQATAALMQPQEGAVFRQTVDEEREILFNEYQRDPDSLKHRLGLTPSVAPTLVIHHQQTLGEVVGRTAVRATVWESIFALFRLFR